MRLYADWLTIAILKIRNLEILINKFICRYLDRKRRVDAIKTHLRHFYFESEKGTRSECQAAAVCGIGKREEKNGISLLCKAALAGKVVLL